MEKGARIIIRLCCIFLLFNERLYFKLRRCVIAPINRNMRTVTNIFILNLAISDLLVGIFCIPTTLVDNFITGQNLIKGDMMKICLHCDILWFVYFRLALQCKLSGLIQRTSVCASVFTLVAIAVDRQSIQHVPVVKVQTKTQKSASGD
ncbi:neuropeptide FF receptor 1 like 3 [Misgurnus anguillicaudatus]|uniref:neuropeptide FF receptor 1 like 3 n=1 Tax=Misgurnus anguillicaudatus TaxID=75329 RepID=UPI003CCFA110